MAAIDARFLPIFAFGLIGGIAAFIIGVPMPFMLGGIVGAASFVLWYERNEKKLPKLSRWVRLVSMSIIGAMIGSRFSPELFTLLPQFWISGLALIPFILLAHGGNYAIMRGLGGYDKLDAYFAALPGGIIDSAALAEEAGADLRVVTAQHFIRIILVVTSIPLLFLFIKGDAVGSLAGLSLATTDYDFIDENGQTSQSETYFSHYHGEIDWRTFFHSMGFICNAAGLFTREVYEQIGPVNEAPELKAHEDFEYWMRILMQYDGFFMDRKLVGYRVHSGSIQKLSPWKVFQRRRILHQVLKQELEIPRSDYLRKTCKLWAHFCFDSCAPAKQMLRRLQQRENSQ